MTIYISIPAFCSGWAMLFTLQGLHGICVREEPPVRWVIWLISISSPPLLVQIGYYMAVIIPSSGIPFYRIVATETYLGRYTDYLTNVALAPHISISRFHTCPPISHSMLTKICQGVRLAEVGTRKLHLGQRRYKPPYFPYSFMHRPRVTRIPSYINVF